MLGPDGKESLWSSQRLEQGVCLALAAVFQ